MDIPRKWGDKFYPATHLIGYRPERYEKRTRFLPGMRDRPYVKKAENIVQTAIATWVGLVFLGKLRTDFACGTRS